MQSVDNRFLAKRFVATYDQQGPLAAGQELRHNLSQQGLTPDEILEWVENNKDLVHKEFIEAGWVATNSDPAEVVELETHL